MADFEEFLARLFRDGEVVFTARPEPSGKRTEAGDRLLTWTYKVYQLDVAGPAIPFRIDIARQAGEVVRQACWAMVNRTDRVEELQGRLTMAKPPRSPSDHLSADLLLRYLPRVYRRAKGTGPGDPLVGLLAEVLRRWPLSGVMAGLDEPPLTSLELGGHPGLLLLYNERFLAQGRPLWEPEGLGREYLELVRYAADAAKESK